MQKEYIVTLKKFEDLDNFYEDMETLGGNLYIPDRKVDCHLRRPISRNTHYLLTDEEADVVRQDPRVLDVQLTPEERGLTPTLLWSQTGDFTKDVYSAFSSNDKNWGLWRCITGEEPTDNWGEDGDYNTISDTIRTSSSGRYVDIVIVDEHVNANHPEFAVNPDGSGGSRVNLIDWFQTYSSYLGIVTSANYTYDFTGSHGTHVAGTAAGNTQGWARDANIYNISPFYSPSPSPTSWTLLLFDYIRAFHKNKPINPVTGRRNPTITNNSWGYSISSNLTLSGISSVTYRGTTIGLSGLTTSQKRQILESNGVPVPYTNFLTGIPSRQTSVDADVVDAIADGVLVLAAAGNGYWQHSIPGDIDYDNRFIHNGVTYYHTRGSTPADADGVVCVGAVDGLFLDVKADFSDFGPAIDIWAPGENIISAIYNSSDAMGGVVVNDPRDSNYKLAATGGTSMATPQVTGVVACLLEQQPDMTQEEIMEYLTVGNGSKSGQLHLQEPSQEWSDYGELSPTESPYFTIGSTDNNRYLYYWPKRPYEGHIHPSTNHKSRPTTGQVFPRIRGKR